MNEKNRGGKNRPLNETETMNQKSRAIVSKIHDIKRKIILQKKSAGIDKINAILNQLLHKNLNNIENIIFDEPENFLDETNLKYLVDIFEVIEKNDIRLFFSTHSSRFLELSSAQINEIFVLSVSFEEEGLKRKIVNNSLKDIKRLYNKTRNELKDDVCLQDMSTGEMTMFSKISLSEEGEILDLYLKTLIEDNEFYKILFYKKIILVEGLTEKLILSKIPGSNLEYMNFYFSSGKIHIPFLIELFLLFGVSVIAMFDSDKIEGKQTINQNITKYLISRYEKSESVTIIASSERDLEADYNISEIIDEFSLQSGISKSKLKQTSYFKPYKALYAFEKNKKNYRLLIELLNPVRHKENTFELS